MLINKIQILKDSKISASDKKNSNEKYIRRKNGAY